MDLWTSFGIGTAAGLAVAMPMGAIGLLLLQEGTLVGVRRAWPAAAGVATADLAYCAVVLVFGSVIAPALRVLAPWPALTSGIVLVALGGRGLQRAWRGPDRGAARAVSTAGPGRRYLGYLGLTVINPATATSFLAVIAAVEPGRSGVGGSVAFALGVTLASLAWQSLLVAAGGVMHRRGNAAVRTVTVAAGNAMIVTLGAVILVGTVSGG
jgi:threonine/homoserine/homoserine lactone efflux protein